MAEVTVLVVDDDPVIMRLLEVNFEMEGYAVVTATDGQQALDQIASAAPDLVVCDIMMPVVNGLEVVERLRRRGGIASATDSTSSNRSPCSSSDAAGGTSDEATGVAVRRRRSPPAATSLASVPTVGSRRSCSYADTTGCDVPARRARSACDRPFRMRTARTSEPGDTPAVYLIVYAIGRAVPSDTTASAMASTSVSHSSGCSNGERTRVPSPTKSAGATTSRRERP
jgi:CheY-like chemotaxis protein